MLQHTKWWVNLLQVAGSHLDALQGEVGWALGRVVLVGSAPSGKVAGSHLDALLGEVGWALGMVVLVGGAPST